MPRRLMLVLPLIVFGSLAEADTQITHDPSRGELLYATHCDACHNVQVHWRDRKIVTDWTSLQAEVRRWQGVAGLGWSNQDIDEVARYLNAVHYHYPGRE